jgi:glycosyltransferase involved in cell wall biosynthesis
MLSLGRALKGRFFLAWRRPTACWRRAKRVTAVKVAVNAHLLSGQPGYRRAGIHHYMTQLLRHLPLTGLDVTVFTNDDGRQLATTNLKMRATRWPTGRPYGRILWEQLVWPWQLRQFDLLHSMAFVTPLAAPCPAVVTVYDLSFIHYPDRFPRFQRHYLTSQTRRSCHAARRVITISESGRQDVHDYFGLPLERITVVRPGVDGVFQPLPAAQVEAFRRREALPEQFLLHVGTLQPRKNIPLLLEALARLERPELQLVLVGGRGWLYDAIFNRVADLGLEKQVRFTGYVADSDLPLWYNAATLLLFPSVYEGFGLPVAQAMACGTPVAAANVAAMPEVAGEAALLFAPDDVEAVAAQIAAVLDDSQLAAALAAKGINQAQQFSWTESGRVLAAVYQSTL